MPSEDAAASLPGHGGGVRLGNAVLHNACDLVVEEGRPGRGLLRLPREVSEQVNDGAKRMARHGAGCEIRALLAEGGAARVVLQCEDDNVVPPIVTVYHGCFRSQVVHLEPSPTEIRIRHPERLGAMASATAGHELPFDPRLVRICLPNIHPCRILSVEGDLCPPPAGSTPATTLLSYGSSITHGASAALPEGSYPAQCARRLGCDLINLGFGGAAQMDPPIARHIAGRNDWDIATLEMGINVRSWPLAKFRAAVQQFVDTIANAHPDKLILCIDLFTWVEDLRADPGQALGFREAVAQVVAERGSPRIVHVDGRTILTDPAGLGVDLVHPTDAGMAEMGRRLAEEITRFRAALQTPAADSR